MNELETKENAKCEMCKRIMYKSKKEEHRCWTGEDAAEFEDQPDFERDGNEVWSDH